MSTLLCNVEVFNKLMTCENEGIVLALSWSEVLWAMLVDRSLKGVKISYEPENFNNSDEKVIAMIRTQTPETRAYRKAGYLTMVIAGYIPANSQLAAAIATIVKSLSIGK